MSIYRILQIGDIHYPDKENFASIVDNKDSGFPERIVELIGTPPLQCVFRELTNRIEAQRPDAIVCMGDFTNRGDLEGLHNGLKYLRGLLSPEWTSDDDVKFQLLFGNHDIDRKDDPDNDVRFNRINDVIVAQGFAQASVAEPSLINIFRARSEVRIYGINSCRGCGQTRLLGSLISRLAGEAIKLMAIEGSSEPDLRDIYEHIDTPAIGEDTISSLTKNISSLPETGLPIICSHHNLLPQITPRIAPYSELINAGTVRAALMEMQRPVIYLHGHIHADPIEVVRNPETPKSAVISVSAPLLRDGFNEIELAFSSDDIPMGCRIRRYQRRDGHIIRGQPRIVPLWSASEGYGLISSDSRNIIQSLPPDRIMHRSDIISQNSVGEEIVDASLDELNWLGLITIQNADRPKIHWRVMRAI